MYPFIQGLTLDILIYQLFNLKYMIWPWLDNLLTARLSYFLPMPRKFIRQEVALVLSSNQKQLLAEVFGNIAVAWFTAGVISPVFLENIFPTKLLFSVGLGILFAAGFILTALLLIKSKG